VAIVPSSIRRLFSPQQAKSVLVLYFLEIGLASNVTYFGLLSNRIATRSGGMPEAGVAPRDDGRPKAKRAPQRPLD
jgi:hypothetical protein